VSEFGTSGNANFLERERQLQQSVKFASLGAFLGAGNYHRDRSDVRVFRLGPSVSHDFYPRARKTSHHHSHLALLYIMTMLHETTASYMRLFAFSELSQLFKGNLAQWRLSDLCTGMLLLSVLIAPAKRRSAFVIVLRAMHTIIRLPYVWDAEILGLLSAAAVLPLLSHSASSNASRKLLVAALDVRAALCALYVSAGFWKLNSSFLNRKYSCGSIYAVQLLEAYAPLIGVEPSPGLASAATSLYSPCGPLMTALGEIAIGVGFALSAPRARRMAVALGLVLHLGICLTPPPNNIGAFSVAAAAKFFWAVPFEASVSIGCAVRSPTALAMHACAGGLLYALANLATNGAQVEDAPLFFYGAIFSMLAQALMMRETSSSHAEASGKRLMAASARQGMLIASLLWAASVPLGLLDIAAPNMFSNLKQHAGSNHVFGAPTGLIQAAFVYAAPHRMAGGGVVRIEHASSGSYIGAVYPAEVSARITPRARALLRAIGHSGRQWHSALARVVGPFALPQQPERAASYTLPALELRRVLAETAQRGKAFSVVVSWLHGTEGDEAWRRSTETSVRLELGWKPSEGWQCSESGAWWPWMGGKAADGGQRGCEALLQGLRHGVTWWDWLLGWPQAWKSMPLIEGDEDENGVHCGS
jgi:hypothetical protein